MKIVLANEKRSWGGSQAIAAALARGLRARGHEVVLFCRARSALHERLAGEIPCEPVLGGFDASPLALWRCAAALRRHRAEVVVTNTVKGPRQTGLAARLLGIPLVYRQEFDQPYKNRLRYRLFFGWVPAHHVVNSRATLRTLLDAVDWIPPERISMIPNGIDPAPFLGARPAALGLPEDGLAIGFIGRVEERKGVRELAAAWPAVAQAVPTAHLLLAGSGPLEEELRAALTGAPRVHWLGYRSDMPEVMAALDVLVAPSHYEGFGLVLVEAMTASVAVVATACSSIPEIIEDDVHGRLVPVHAPAALARALIQLARNQPLRARMGRAGRERALREFTLERMLDEHEALLAAVVARARGRSTETVRVSN